MITSKRTHQIYQTCDTWKEAQDIIRKHKMDGFYVTQLYYSNATFSMIMEKGLTWGDQVWITQKDFPDGSKMEEYRGKGYMVTSLCAYPLPNQYTVEWVVVMTKQTHLTQQKHYVTAEFPENRIQEGWRDGYQISSLAYAHNHWVLVISKGISPEVSWEKTFDFSEAWIQKIHQDKRIVTSLIYAGNSWVAVCEKRPEISIQEIVKTPHYPNQDIKKYWGNSFDVAWVCYGEGQWFASYITYKDKNVILQQMATKALQERQEKSEQFLALYRKGEFMKASLWFEQELAKLQPTEDELYHYFWSLWQHPNSKPRTWDALKQYTKGMNTPRFDLIKGHFAAWKKWYDYALEYYKGSSEADYQNVNTLFESYKQSYLQQNYTEVIQTYQKEFQDSISESTAWVAEYYIWATYQNSKNAQTAMDLVSSFKEKVPNYAWNTVAAHIFKDVGLSTKNIEFLNMALQLYKERATENEVHIQEIEQYKIAIQSMNTDNPTDNSKTL